ncbi:MAG: hypothetical protein WCI43_09545, partial [Candidatus Firestonebacteria bacterium]
MKHCVLLIAGLLLLPAFYAFAAEPPHLGFVYPAGGRQGSVLEVEVGGKAIKNASGVIVNGSDVYAVILPEEILAPFGEVSGESKETFKKREKVFQDKKAKKNRRNDPFPETLLLRIAILDRAEPGERELRLITPGGLSNRVAFRVGTLTEAQELEPNNRKDQANEVKSLPAVLNGQILAGDTDCFKIPGKKGQLLTLKAEARSLKPFMADAVPGWFQASMALYDSKGAELCHSDNFLFNQEPLLFYEVPENGDYTVEIRDSIYRGREDFVYRIAVGELSYITRCFPLGAQAGSTAVVSIYGKNLDRQTTEVNTESVSLP